MCSVHLFKVLAVIRELSIKELAEIFGTKEASDMHEGFVFYGLDFLFILSEDSARKVIQYAINYLNDAK